MTLNGVARNVCCVVSQLPQLPLLNSLGLRPGSRIKVLAKQPLGGPVVVQIGNRSIALGRDLAQQIVVDGVG